jgi:hypothetical protein
VRELGEVLRERGPSVEAGAPTSVATPALCLQLLPVPRSLAVKTAERRDHDMPVGYCDLAGGQRSTDVQVLTTVGPDRISGGAEVGEPYARDYFQCVTAEGMLVLLYHDVLAGRWYLHGWWD